MSAESLSKTRDTLELLSKDYQKQYVKLHEQLQESLRSNNTAQITQIVKQMKDLLETILDPSFTLDDVPDTCSTRVKRTLKKVGLCFLSGLASYFSVRVARSLPYEDLGIIDLLYTDPLKEWKTGGYVAFFGFLLLTKELAKDVILSAKSLHTRQTEDLQELKKYYGELSEKLTYLETLNKSGSLTIEDIKEKFSFGKKGKSKKSKVRKSVKKSKNVRKNVRKSVKKSKVRKSRKVRK